MGSKRGSIEFLELRDALDKEWMDVDNEEEKVSLDELN
jgi:hypothetical protein